MTVEEKRELVWKHCEESDCPRCKLFQVWKRNDESCIPIRSATEEELDWALRIINGIESDSVNHPSHYQGKHECIDEMIALFGVEAVKAFCKCNVYKYRYRAAAKNGQEDLDKANWYMDKLLELEGEKA